MKIKLALIPLSYLIVAVAHGSGLYIPQVKGPFTLTYEAVRTPAMTRTVMADGLASLKLAFQNDKKNPLPPNGAQAALADAKQYYESQLAQQKEERFTETISSDGKSLLVKSQPKIKPGFLGKAKTPVIVLLFSGGQFTKDGVGSGLLRDQIVSTGLEDLPFLGVELPFLPFQNGGEYLDTSQVDSRALKYVSGKATAKPNAPVSRLLLGPSGKEPTEILLADYRTVNGIPVAGTIQVNERYFGIDPKLAGTVVEKTTFRLTKIETTNPPAESLDPATYLVKGDFTSVTMKGVNKTFRFDGTKGSLLAQFEDARLREKIAQSRQVRSQSSALSGALFGVLAICTGGYFVSKTRRGKV